MSALQREKLKGIPHHTTKCTIRASWKNVTHGIQLKMSDWTVTTTAVCVDVFYPPGPAHSDRADNDLSWPPT